MGHQAEDIPGLVAHAGDVTQRPVRILARRVAEQDLARGLEAVELGVGRVEAPGHVLDRDREALAGLARPGERADRADHVELDLAKDELQREVGQQRTGQELRLAQDLEAVADPEHEPALARERLDLGHHRGKACDRPRAQVVAVGEAARDDHRIDPLEVVIGVPQEHGFADARRCLEGIDVVAGAGEADDPELHAGSPVSPSSISQSSISGFVSSRSHIAGNVAGSSTSSSISRPTWTLRTPSKPSAGSARSTAWPCGSRIPALGLTRTLALIGTDLEEGSAVPDGSALARRRTARR